PVPASGRHGGRSGRAGAHAGRRRAAAGRGAAVIIGGDTASSRWHAAGRADWMPRILTSKCEVKKGRPDERRQKLAESFDAFLAAAVLVAKTPSRLPGEPAGPTEPVHV